MEGHLVMSASCASTTISYVMLIEKQRNAKVSHGSGRIHRETELERDIFLL